MEVIFNVKEKELMEQENMSKKSENYRGIYKDMVEVLGHDITLKVYESYKGQQITFPMRLYSEKYVIDYLNKHYNGKNLKQMYFILNLCAKFSLKSQPSIYGKYGKWIL